METADTDIADIPVGHNAVSDSYTAESATADTQDDLNIASLNQDSSESTEVRSGPWVMYQAATIIN